MRFLVLFEISSFFYYFLQLLLFLFCFLNLSISLSDFPQDLINNDQVKIKKLKKNLAPSGKKRGRAGTKGDHNKYSDDNLKKKNKKKIKKIT